MATTRIANVSNTINSSYVVIKTLLPFKARNRGIHTLPAPRLSILYCHGAVNKILNGTNAISRPYDQILLNELNCDLNFIYGGIARSDMLTNEINKIEQEGASKVLKRSVIRMMKYLMGILDTLD